MGLALRARARILVERDSQKGMVIGHGGAVLKRVGTAVRAQLPAGAYVELSVRVARTGSASLRCWTASASDEPPRVRVYVEAGAKRVFACSLEWPGLCRVAKTEEAALLVLSEYTVRYAPLAARAGVGPGRPGRAWEVVERVPTRSGGADFGVPTTVLERDHADVAADEAARTSALLSADWDLLDEVVAAAPGLAQGPARRRPGPGRHRGPRRVRPSRCSGRRWASSCLSPPRATDAVVSGQPGGHPRVVPVGQALPLATARAGWPPRYAARRLFGMSLTTPGRSKTGRRSRSGRQ